MGGGKKNQKTKSKGSDDGSSSEEEYSVERIIKRRINKGKVRHNHTFFRFSFFFSMRFLF